jgi:UDP-N-acetylmuramate: L-alanyl-gamma-D-glutamyl-meso-diaminopimelate ligase
MELVADENGIQAYDDFAHHPTAIKSTLAGIKRTGNYKRVWAVIEPRSNTMRMGVHKAALPDSIEDADDVIWFQPKGLDWDIESVVDECTAQGHKSVLFDDIDAIIAHLVEQAESGDAIVLMSNGGFGGIHQKLAAALKG